MIKALMFEGDVMDEPTAWGDYPSESDALADFEMLAEKAFPINADVYDEKTFLIKFINPKTRKSYKKYDLVVWVVPTLTGNRVTKKLTLKE